jgi:dienelactone hydrolase
MNSAVPSKLARGLVAAMLLVAVAPAYGETTASWSNLVPRVQGAKQYYVGVAGKPDNAGTAAEPWDIASALDGKRTIEPGAVIWIKGGTYKHPSRNSPLYQVKLAGTKEAPIHVRAMPGERATLDGGLFIAPGSAHLWVWDLEIMFSETNRVSPNASAPPGYPAVSGIEIRGGSDCKYINLTIHDCFQGMGFWIPATDSEVHGCVIYNNGYQGQDRHHGHSIYTQNKTGTKTITGCILSARRDRTDGSFTMHVYGSGKSALENYVIEDNIAYEVGTFLVGGGAPVRNVKLSRNYLHGINMQLGYGAQNDDCELRDNLIAGGKLTINKFKKVVNENNPETVPDQKTVLIPNKYDPTRANVAIYNGAKADKVALDVGKFLKAGEKYRLLNPRDLFGKPVLEGKADGASIAVPMAGEFAAFVLLKEGEQAAQVASEPLPGTKPLQTEGDLAARMVEGIDKYLMRELAASVEKRKQYWKPDFSSPQNYAKSVEPNRERLKKIIGVVDARLPVKMEYVATTDTPALVAESDLYKVLAVRWPVFEGVDGEGLLLEPKGKVVANVVAIPDADWTPEMLVGLAAGVPKEAQFARRLAENGCRVIVPVLIDRKDTWSGNAKFNRFTNQPHREFIYRMAFEMGRHIIGYEVQKVVAAVDWFCREKGHETVGIYGYGEGGQIGFYAAAIDDRIKAVAVNGYFGPREGAWEEPIYRNVWGLVREFGDAEVAAYFYMPWFKGPDRRPLFIKELIVDNGKRPMVDGPPAPRPGRAGAAPGRLVQPQFPREGRTVASAEIQRALQMLKGSKVEFSVPMYHHEILGLEPPLTTRHTLREFIGILHPIGIEEKWQPTDGPLAAERRQGFDPSPRQHRQFDQLVEHTQRIFRESEGRRHEAFWKKIDTSSVEKFEKSTEAFRNYLWEEVIGKLPPATEPLNPRTRQAYDEPKWKGYEVTLDLYPDVVAYGILLLPKDLKPGEKRPVVVCQHGLEGRPQDVVNPKERTKYYNSFGAQLADLGYIVYAPQNPYIGQDKFRVLQRKANPLKLSLFSFIVRQHERTLDWLATLPFVDGDRIGFYGLSYGGKTAMRVPALLPRYKLSICSGDFNEWIMKNVSTDYRATFLYSSYMYTGEYEMPEFDLGNTFNYAEMAALIAPRPFMVERGHNDGVGIDEMIAYEYAKVRRLYSRLKMPERTDIEFFAGAHEINGKRTFAFLKKHLSWPE